MFVYKLQYAWVVVAISQFVIPYNSSVRVLCFRITMNSS